MRVLYGIKEQAHVAHPFLPTFQGFPFFGLCLCLLYSSHIYLLIQVLRFIYSISLYLNSAELESRGRSLRCRQARSDFYSSLSSTSTAISSKWSSSLLSQITTSLQVHCAYEHDFVLKLCSTIVLTQISLQLISRCFPHCVCNKIFKNRRLIGRPFVTMPQIIYV